ncbi:type VI secretion system lipoprotein TssJ [Roseibium sp. TrichSKD4]|uniref:type VI secretion system lipoprotein TssJ n=1 Tax=Roseibium sp. TrichSKD4 TaxID=744980 RepID=UPI001AD94D44|nr:type VI secretion system lipoprotein TssJ [Roseibium sp. TrichSKD4]
MTASKSPFWRLSLRMLSVGCLVTGAVLLSACGAQEIPGKVIKVIADPKIAVGEPKDQPTLVDITVYAEPGANRNDGGEAVPIDVWIFQLSDDGKFFQAEFDRLTTEPAAVLSTTFVKVKEVQVPPGESKTINELELKKDTTFIGIAGGYVDPDKVDWRTVEAVKSKGETYKLLAVMNRRKIITNLHR